MNDWLKRMFEAPVFENDEDKTYSALLVNGILSVFLAAAIFFLIVGGMTIDISESHLFVTLASSLTIIFIGGLKFLLYRGYVRLCGVLLSLTLWGCFTLPMYIFDGVRDTALTGYFVAIVVASLVLGRRCLCLFSLLSTFSVVGFYALERSRIIVVSHLDPIAPIDLVTVLITLNTTALLAGITVHRMAQGYARARRNAQQLSETNRQLETEITARKRIEEQISRLAAIIEQAAEVVVMTDLDGNIVYVNPSFESITGYTSTEVLGQNLRLLKSGNQDAAFYEELWNAITAGHTWTGMFINKRKDGGLYHEAATIFPIKNPEGTIINYAAVKRDITKQVQAEEERKISEEKYMALYNHAPLAYQSLDEQGCFLDVNPAWLHTLGYQRENVIGHRFADFLHPDWKPHFEKNFPAFKQRGYVHDVEFKIKHNDGQYLDISFEGCIGAHPDGSFRQTYCVFRDITGRKRAETELQRLNQELEERVDARTRELQDIQGHLLRQEKLAVLGQMAGSVGHELRTPLATITNAVYFLKMVQTGADDTTQEYLGIIGSEVRTAEKIISDLLDFSRVKSLDRRPIRVADGVRVVFGKHEPPDSVQIVTEIPDDLPAMVVDPTHLDQVLGNLVTNAYQAMPDGGTLSVSARAEGEMVAIDVRDTGVGITPDNMNKLFEPLFTTKAKGIGLGLAVCRNLVEANGGAINVGSTFTMSWPAVKEEDTA